MEGTKKFINYMRDHPGKAEWNDPRDGATRTIITFKRERPIADRLRGKALSSAWEFTKEKVTVAPRYSADMRIITDTRRGIISLASPVDLWELFRLDATADGFTHNADSGNLEHFGIPRAEFEHLLGGTRA